MRCGSRRAAPAALVLVAVVGAGCGGGQAPSVAATASPAAPTPLPTDAPTAAPSPTPAGPNGLFDIGGGRRLYLECIGEGSPTIVIDVGNDDTIHGSWEEVFRPMSEISRTCAYDRANLGRSDPAPGPRTVSNVAEDLVALLDVADVPGPYVFVGGSFGGNVVGVLSANHPELVAGLVFIDSEPATLPKDNPFARNLPDGVFESCCMPPAWQDNGEHLDYAGGVKDEIATVGKQPPVPAIVLTATQIECDPAWPCAKILEDEIALQARWIEGNELGKQIQVTSGHVMQRELPAAIVNHTRTVVEQVRSG